MAPRLLNNQLEEQRQHREGERVGQGKTGERYDTRSRAAITAARSDVRPFLRTQHEKMNELNYLLQSADGFIAASHFAPRSI
ncbi:hypothetical protein FACS1894216_12200 [Synergistales bacterium]|nr:hypothetical protein FACS1894216_12200 [Synergistales bacterium]